MREQKYAYYAIDGGDGLPRVCHAVVGFQPEGSVEITQEQAVQITAAVRAAEPPTSAPVPAGYVTREEAEALARKAAQDAIAAFAASVINPTGG